MKAKWLIIGNSHYTHDLIVDVPAVEQSIRGLESAVKFAYKDDVSVDVKSDLTNFNFLSCIGEHFRSVGMESDNTVAFFYFCGHGYRRGGSLYLAATDSQPNYIESCSVAFSSITNAIKDNKIKYAVIILDCCYSGTANGLSSDNDFSPDLPDATYPHMICLTSCRGVEKAFFTEENGSCFAAYTYQFALTIKNGIDNLQHWVSLGELNNIIREKIDNQNPTIRATGSFDTRRIIPNALYPIKKAQLTGDREHTNKALKVLLVKSAIRYPIKGDGDFGVPLGLWLLKSFIQRTTYNIVVDVFDERLRRLQGATESFEECAKKYDVIGASMCSCEVPSSLEKMRIAKRLGKITIAGGIFTYTNEKYLLSYPFVDFVIPGVGTTPLAALLNELRKRKEHIGMEALIKYIGENNFDGFGLQNVFSKNTLADSIMWEAAIMPYIELDIWDEILKLYGPFINNKMDIYTSRGCNKACSFCSVQRETKHNVIICDDDHVIRTIDYLYKKGIRTFSIKDEDFFLHEESRIRGILECFKEYDDISFKIRARIDTMLQSSVSVSDLAQYHISEIQYGVESPEDDLRKQVQKSIGKSCNDVINLFKLHYEYNIVVNASFILGLAGEDRHYYSALTNFVQQIYVKGKTKVYLNFYTPHPVKGRIPEHVYLISNDLNYFTHKIPVCYPKYPLSKAPIRKKMLETYDKIIQMTDSQLFNPKIPSEIQKKFTMGNQSLDNSEIMRYGDDNQ